MEIVLSDFEAMSDMLDAFTETIDDLTVEQAVRFEKAIGVFQKKAKLAQEFLKTRTLTLIEKQPAVVDGSAYMRKPDRKWRPNQRKIQSAVVQRAVFDPQTGERVTEPMEAAANAVVLMYDLFVAPSQFPKQEGLKKLHLTNVDVGENEITGHSLKVVEVDAGD